MSSKIFVNLPVRNLNKSIEFFTELGYRFNQQFTDETATCMIVTDDIFVMLLTEEKFKTFTPKEICDAKNTQRYWYAYLSKAEQRSMRWFKKPSLPEAPLTMNRKTMVLCTAMDSRTWMVTFGSSSTWSLAR
jgi:hypothetical protein